MRLDHLVLAPENILQNIELSVSTASRAWLTPRQVNAADTRRACSEAAARVHAVQCAPQVATCHMWQARTMIIGYRAASMVWNPRAVPAYHPRYRGGVFVA